MTPRGAVGIRVRCHGGRATGARRAGGQEGGGSVAAVPTALPIHFISNMLKQFRVFQIHKNDILYV